jgi:hypothetical protein
MSYGRTTEAGPSTRSGSWRSRAAPVHLLRAVLQPLERGLRATLELLAQ